MKEKEGREMKKKDRKDNEKDGRRKGRSRKMESDRKR